MSSPIPLLNNWEEDKICLKDKILEFEFLTENDYITEIEDGYFYLNTSFPIVEQKFYDEKNKQLADELNLKDVNKEIDNFIKKLNKYNEAKDIADSLMGKIADFKGCSIKDIHLEFGLQASED